MYFLNRKCMYCSDVTMNSRAYQITGNSSVCPTVRLTPKKTSKPVLQALCEGNPPVTSGLPSQKVSNAESFSMWLRHRWYDWSSILASVFKYHACWWPGDARCQGIRRQGIAILDFHLQGWDICWNYVCLSKHGYAPQKCLSMTNIKKFTWFWGTSIGN